MTKCCKGFEPIYPTSCNDCPVSFYPLELLVDYVVPRNQPVSRSRDVSLASAARKEKTRKRGDAWRRGKKGRRAERRQRDERDERVGELIRRQECRPETPAGLYSFPDIVPGKPDGPESSLFSSTVPSTISHRHRSAIVPQEIRNSETPVSLRSKKIPDDRVLRK